MPRHCRAAFTLLELLVVMGVFALVLTMTLGFYAWGAHTTDYQRQRMDVYRHTLEAVDRVLNAVATSTLLYVTPTEIVFAPHVLSAPLDRVAWRWPAQAVTLALRGSTLVWASGTQRDTLLVLSSTQSLQFKATSVSGGQRPVFQSLEVDTADVMPKMDSHAPGSTFSIQRSILLRTPY